MARRSFSLLLARRYLNPRRALLSSFTMISLIGVLLGVLVLVVVMAVYSGLERQVKERLLGFTPHILLRYEPMTQPDAPLDWRKTADSLKGRFGIEAATASIADNVILDVGTLQKPVMFQGVDTEDAGQVEGVERMLDRENFPDSNANMKLEDRVVISSTVAEQYQLHTGDTVRLYSTRNFEKVLDAYKSTEKPPVRESYAGELKQVRELLEKGWKNEIGHWAIRVEVLKQAHDVLDNLRYERIREPERKLIEAAMVAMEDNEKDEKAGVYRFTGEGKEAVGESLSELDKTDAEKMDGEILKGLKDIVLPKEAKVAGVYRSSQMTITPDLFMPLPLAQTLGGLGDSVQGISLRLDDPYRAGEVAPQVLEMLGPDWRALTWMEQYEGFFQLINQQRVMMYFALSFIVLVSAFSMMAVMFTVTIQKRREIGVMKALGAAPGQIVRVFLYQGMILGVVGAALGWGLGRVVIHYRGEIQVVMRGLGFDPFAASFTGFSVLPAHNNPAEQGVIAFAAFVLCSLAALVPAAMAARSDAAKSLRNL